MTSSSYVLNCVRRCRRRPLKTRWLAATSSNVNMVNNRCPNLLSAALALCTEWLVFHSRLRSSQADEFCADMQRRDGRSAHTAMSSAVFAHPDEKVEPTLHDFTAIPPPAASEADNRVASPEAQHSIARSADTPAPPSLSRVTAVTMPVCALTRRLCARATAKWTRMWYVALRSRRLLRAHSAFLQVREALVEQDWQALHDLHMLFESIRECLLVFPRAILANRCNEILHLP